MGQRLENCVEKVKRELMGWGDIFPAENRYYQSDDGILFNGDSAEVLKSFPDDSVDLVVTSPPYDGLRNYGFDDIGDAWNFGVFQKIAKQLARVLKPGGVIVWVVGDAVVDGSETGTSFRQALYFKDECGLRIHDTMIYQKVGVSTTPNALNRYYQSFEYMFVFSKGSPRVTNMIRDRVNKAGGKKNKHTGLRRSSDGSLSNSIERKPVIDVYGVRYNIWKYSSVHTDSNLAYKHPAVFPEHLAYDHIYSWSDNGDIVLDPFAGSGTTLKEARRLKRKWLGIEINREYCGIIKNRIVSQDFPIF